MVDGLGPHALQHGEDALRVSHVTLAVDADRVITLRAQVLEEMMPDEAVGSGDECFHDRIAIS